MIKKKLEVLAYGIKPDTLLPETRQTVDITEWSHGLKQFIHVLPEPLRENAGDNYLY